MTSTRTWTDMAFDLWKSFLQGTPIDFAAAGYVHAVPDTDAEKAALAVAIEERLAKSGRRGAYFMGNMVDVPDGFRRYVSRVLTLAERNDWPRTWTPPEIAS